MQTAQQELRLAGLVNELVASGTAALHAIVSRLTLLIRISQERKQLLDMPEHQLKDIGITRMQAIEEANRHGLPVSRV